MGFTEGHWNLQGQESQNKTKKAQTLHSPVIAWRSELKARALLGLSKENIPPDSPPFYRADVKEQSCQWETTQASVQQAD